MLNSVVNSTQTSTVNKFQPTDNGATETASNSKQQSAVGSLLSGHQLQLSNAKLSLINDVKSATSGANSAATARPASRDSVIGDKHRQSPATINLSLHHDCRSPATASGTRLPEDVTVVEPRASPYSSSDQELGTVAAGLEDSLNDHSCVYISADSNYPSTTASSSVMAEDGDNQALTCQHHQQLTKLRHNVMCLLNVLAPSVCVNVNLDFNTTQIDDLLHEVLFGAVDESVNNSVTEEPK